MKDEAFERFDFIVDDGLHYETAQRGTLSFLWPLLERGFARFLIEDIHHDWGEKSHEKLLAVHRRYFLAGGHAPCHYQGVPGLIEVLSRL